MPATATNRGCFRKTFPTLVACAGAWLLVVPARGQVATPATDTTVLVADPGDVAGEARAAQALFERRRLRLLPLALDAPGGTCDERVGRFCTWYGEGEWYPVPEDDRIVAMRTDLIATLDSLQPFVPRNEWLFGQRVWYRTEAGSWDDAWRTARACGDVADYWCAALEGFALHGLGRFEDAYRAYQRALMAMDSATARRWRVPEWPVESSVRDRLDDVKGDAETEALLLDRLWQLADPLYLVAGNDRLTEHFARWTVTELRERARNPFHIRWGSDMDQLTVRHGWELGWERSPSRDFSSLDDVIGHKHPEGRDYMPPGDVLLSPERASPEDLRPDRQRPRSLYAPAYAPVLLPMDAQVGVFPRAATTLILASPVLPEDTTYHSGHEHALPWMTAGDQASLADRIGLFAAPVEGGEVRAVTRTGSPDGALVLEVATGDYVISVESWSPKLRRAGRDRAGVPAARAPADVATLSSLILLSPSVPEPNTPEEAVRTMLPRARVVPGQTFAIAWEVVGLGFRPETLDFEVSVRRTDRGVVRRIGEFLRLADRPRPLALSWEEPAPDEPGPLFRYLELELPGMETGEYEVELILRTSDRSDAVVRRAFEVVRPR